jgi:hypothetical protein
MGEQENKKSLNMIAEIGEQEYKKSLNMVAEMGEQENKKSLNIIAEMGEQENKKSLFVFLFSHFGYHDSCLDSFCFLVLPCLDSF